MAKTELAKRKDDEAATTTALALAADFAADAGSGMEGAGQDAFAIPFLSVLQKGSPQVDEASGTAIEGARAGMLFENVTGTMYSGKEGVLLVPCAYRREFLRWAPREIGGGFKGAHPPEVIADLRAKGQIVEVDGQLYAASPDGVVDPKRNDRYKDTRNHYVLVINPETGGWTEALLSLNSTQIKKSKMLMSALASVKLRTANGQMYTPPTFANYVRVTTAGESNDKGSWFGVKFELAGTVDRNEVYAAAKAFHANVAKGSVSVKYEDAAEAGSEQDGKF